MEQVKTMHIQINDNSSTWVMYAFMLAGNYIKP